MQSRSQVALLPLTALSTVVLALEVFLSRLVSYSVHVILLYAVIGIAMLGFGAAGSLVAVRPGWVTEERLPRALAWSALTFAVTVVVANAVFVRLTPMLHEVGALSFAVASLLTLPFMAAATTITLALTGAGEHVGRAYGANLIGSGLGCFVPLYLLGPLDGEHFLALMSVLAWGCALLYVRAAGEGPRSPLTWATWAALAPLLAVNAFAGAVFPIQPEPEPLGQLAGQYAFAAKHGIEIEKKFDRWNPTGRIEIIEFSKVAGSPDPYPAMFYAQDSTAGSSLVRWDGRDRQERPKHEAGPHEIIPRMCSETLYGQGYFRPRNRALIIGLGGGPDVQCALYNQAQQVDVVEINRDSIAAIRGPFNEHVGGIGHRDNVRFHVRDGRSFIHDRRHDGYDLIQLSGVDTKQNYASGALALSENHLYTREAFRDYLSSLSPTGAMSIIRFGEPEALRLANTAVEVLRELGVEAPHNHLFILQTGVAYGVVIARSPITPEDAAAIRERVNPSDFKGFEIFYYNLNGVPFHLPPLIQYLPHTQDLPPFRQYFQQVAGGTKAAFEQAYAFNILPTDDDRPFFFDILRYDRQDTWLHGMHVVALRDLLLAVVALSLLLIILPLMRLRERQRGLTGMLTPVFFACVGLAYVLVQVWMLHTFSMFLGHQTYSLSVVLASLLIATGLGASLGSRWLPAPRARVMIGGAAIIGLLLTGHYILPHLLEATWNTDLPVRVLVVIAFVVPTGMAMGQPFVAGLTWLRTAAPPSVPWCIGINGFSSVIASIGVIPLAMGSGYSAAIFLGMALYACATGIGARMRT